MGRLKWWESGRILLAGAVNVAARSATYIAHAQVYVSYILSFESF